MRRLHQILKGESTLDDLLQRHRREAALQDRVQQALPPALAKHVAVIDARSAELELGAASGAAVLAPVSGVVSYAGTVPTSGKSRMRSCTWITGVESSRIAD